MTKHSNIATPSALLILLIAATPVLAISSNRFDASMITLIVATMLLLLPNAPEREMRRGLAISRPLAPLVLLPVAWIALQLVPIPLGTLDHTIWKSASAALPELRFGRVSIDVGSTLLALFQYISLLTLTLITCVIARDRERAENILFSLCAIADFAAIELLLFGNSTNLRAAASGKPFPDNLIAIVSLGTILNMAFIVRAVERFETRAGHEPLSWRTYVVTLITGAGGALLCSIAILVSADNNVLITVAFGWIAFWLVLLLRRFRVGPWTSAVVGAAVVVICIGAIAVRSALAPSVSPFIRFAPVDRTDAIDATLRLLNETNWLGVGVGTYEPFAALNRDAAGLPSSTPITTMCALVLGWGYIGTVVVVAAIAQLLITLFRGAFARGRDAFFAAGAAASIVTIICAAFCDPSFIDVTVQMLTAVIVGTGLAQSVGRQTR